MTCLTPTITDEKVVNDDRWKKSDDTPKWSGQSIRIEQVSILNFQLVSQVTESFVDFLTGNEKSSLAKNMLVHVRSGLPLSRVTCRGRSSTLCMPSDDLGRMDADGRTCAAEHFS